MVKKIFCPKCRRPIPAPDDEPVLACEACNLKVNRLQMGVTPGLANMPVFRDFRGERIGTFEIVELIGQGGTGMVYKARPAAGGPDVALRVLDYNYARKSDFLGRFKTMVQRGFRQDAQEDTRLVLQVFIKAADICNCAKRMELYRIWAEVGDD